MRLATTPWRGSSLVRQLSAPSPEGPPVPFSPRRRSRTDDVAGTAFARWVAFIAGHDARRSQSEHHISSPCCAAARRPALRRAHLRLRRASPRGGARDPAVRFATGALLVRDLKIEGLASGRCQHRRARACRSAGQSLLVVGCWRFLAQRRRPPRGLRPLGARAAGLVLAAHAADRPRRGDRSPDRARPPRLIDMRRRQRQDRASSRSSRSQVSCPAQPPARSRPGGRSWLLVASPGSPSCSSSWPSFASPTRRLDGQRRGALAGWLPAWLGPGSGGAVGDAARFRDHAAAASGIAGAVVGRAVRRVRRPRRSARRCVRAHGVVVAAAPAHIEFVEALRWHSSQRCWAQIALLEGGWPRRFAALRRRAARHACAARGSAGGVSHTRLRRPGAHAA